MGAGSGRFTQAYIFLRWCWDRRLKKQLKFWSNLHSYHVDFIDITQYIFLKGLSESFALRSPDAEQLNAGTLSWTQPLLPFALTVCWWKADVLFSLSLFFFCSLCVNSLSLKHTETSCCIFQVLQVMMLFPLPPRPCFTRPNLNLSHGPWRWKAWLWAGKEAA